MSRPYETERLTEDDLRSFTMCPRFHSFGGTNIYPITTQLLKLSTEKALTECIRNDRLDPSMKYMKALLRSSKELELSKYYMDGQVLTMHNAVGMALGEVFGAFNANDFLPVFGPAPWSIKVSKSAIQITVSGILKTKTRTLHIIDFSPYQDMHGIKNDPIIYLKAQTISQFVKPWFNCSQCVIHVFSLSTANTLLYHKLESAEMDHLALTRIQRIVKAIEMKVDFPVLPCKRDCPFKSKCYLETI